MIKNTKFTKIEDHFKIANITLITGNRPIKARTVIIPDHMIALVVMTLTITTIATCNSFQLVKTLKITIATRHNSIRYSSISRSYQHPSLNASEFTEDTKTNSLFELLMYHQTPHGCAIPPFRWFFFIFANRHPQLTSQLHLNYSYSFLHIVVSESRFSMLLLSPSC